jgi:hypothetical protein
MKTHLIKFTARPIENLRGILAGLITCLIFFNLQPKTWGQDLFPRDPRFKRGITLLLKRRLLHLIRGLIAPITFRKVTHEKGNGLPAALLWMRTLCGTALALWVLTLPAWANGGNGGGASHPNPGPAPGGVGGTSTAPNGGIGDTVPDLSFLPGGGGSTFVTGATAGQGGAGGMGGGGSTVNGFGGAGGEPSFWAAWARIPL